MQSIQLDIFDLKEEHKNRPIYSIRFEHFKSEVQAILVAARVYGVHGFFQRTQMHEVIEMV